MTSANPLQSAKHGDDIILGGGQYRAASEGGRDRFVLSVVNLTEAQHRLVSLDFLPHGIAVDPRHSMRLVVCEKIGPGAAVIDLESMALVQKIRTPKERIFYGHCAFAADGSSLYATETYRSSSKGTIVIRDAATLEITGEFPSFGSAPHECQLIDDGKTMVVTNGGGNSQGAVPNVAYIDVETQTLIKREELTNPALNTGHFALGEDGALVVVSAPRDGVKGKRLGGVSIQPHGKTMMSLSSPAEVVSKMFGEALSVAVHQQTAVVTHPDGDMVTFWSLEDRRFVKSISLPKPRGVTMTRDRSRFVISYGPEANVGQVDANSMELVGDAIYPRSFLSGSHLYNWSELRA